MNKFSVDFADLQSKLTQKKAYRLSDVKDRLKKVAFDVVRFVDSNNIDELWRIERDGDDEYIVAMYSEEDVTKTASSNPWKVIPEKSGEAVHVFLNNEVIKRVSLASVGIPADDAHMVCRMMREKLASDDHFLRAFVNDLTKEEAEILVEAGKKTVS